MTDPNAIDLSSLLGAGLTSSGAVGALAWLFLRSKFDSIKTLWRKFDNFQEIYNKDRLADAKEYATRADVAKAIEHLETSIGQRLLSLETKLDKLIGGGQKQ